MNVRDQVRDVLKQRGIRRGPPIRVVTLLPSVVDIDVAEAMLFEHRRTQRVRLSFDIGLVQESTGLSLGTETTPSHVRVRGDVAGLSEPLDKVCCDQ
jgi:hypothetical protein